MQKKAQDVPTLESLLQRLSSGNQGALLPNN
jgi:hypothetical protein